MQVRLLAGHLDAVRREPNSGLDQTSPGSGSVGPVRGLQPGRRARHGARRRPDLEGLCRLGRIDDIDQLHVGDPFLTEPEAGYGDVEVQQPRRAVPGMVDEHEPSATRARQRALGHPRREARRDARIDGVAALGENLGAGLGRQPVSGSDGSPHLAEA